MRLCALLALLTLLPVPAMAGIFSDWSFEVLEVVEEQPGHRIRLRPVPPGRVFPRSCRSFVVHTHYDLADWSPEGRRSATRKKHERSLRMLLQAQITGKIIHFGSVGIGFAAIADSDECEVASRGLTYVIKSDGSGGVYSVFEEP
jgi:hypothetical protein